MSARAGYGVVLVRPLQDNSIIKLSGRDVYIDTSWQKEKHAITCGEIVSIPDSIPDELKTTVEVKVGDIVFFHYLSVANAIRDDKYFIRKRYDGDDAAGMEVNEVIYPVAYGSLYCAKRIKAISMKDIYDNQESIINRKYNPYEIIPLNGYILVRPILKHTESVINGVYLPEEKLKQEVISKGIVAYQGSPLTGEKALCSVGDEVVFRKSSSVPIQYHLHSDMDEKLYRMKSDSIMAIVQTDFSSEKVLEFDSVAAS